MKKEKAALFDLDGTLFDTTLVNFFSYKEALNKFGHDFSQEFYLEQCHGRVFRDFLPLIIGQDNPDQPFIHQLKKELYPKHLHHAKQNDFLFDIIRALRNTYYIGLVTTASQKNVMDILDYFRVKDLFELILTQEDVLQSKPSPEGYLKAMSHFKVAPSDTIIYEDSEVGLAAARASGAHILKIE